MTTAHVRECERLGIHHKRGQRKAAIEAAIAKGEGLPKPTAADSAVIAWAVRTMDSAGCLLSPKACQQVWAAAPEVKHSGLPSLAQVRRMLAPVKAPAKASKAKASE